ncbi:hypothetical protein KUF71_013279 [Frankliniella fusca]|uniref:Uncharacterized protein n=1 Tax=Frankliniella fusca TaxID=407009 RepID=A0AAE1HQK3_9NEOP|nr:hypothetical protein KUF71_013279 [Frankliniella fusca]
MDLGVQEEEDEGERTDDNVMYSQILFFLQYIYFYYLKLTIETRQKRKFVKPSRILNKKLSLQIFNSYKGTQYKLQSKKKTLKNGLFKNVVGLACSVASIISPRNKKGKKDNHYKTKNRKGKNIH